MQPTSASEGPTLELAGVHAGYSDVPVLRGVDLTVAPGECVAVIGANGAGKSTLLKTVFGEVGVSCGTIRCLGQDLTRRSVQARLDLGVGYVPQGRCNFGLMTVRENLEMGAFRYRGKDLEREIADVYELFPVLREKQRILAGNLSGGEQQLLETGMALMTSPRLLLIDEPSLGLAVGVQRVVFDRLHSLARRGVGILLVEQNAVQALEIADRGVVVEQGRVAYEGAGVGMLDDPPVRRAYLGVAAT